MRIVLDANPSPKLVPHLTQAGHVGDLGMLTSTDAAILARCQADGQVLVTADTEVSMAHDPGHAAVVGRLPFGAENTRPESSTCVARWAARTSTRNAGTRTVRCDASDLGSTKKNCPLASTSDAVTLIVRRSASNRSTWSARSSLNQRPV